jgi:predicted acetyltransferase
VTGELKIRSGNESDAPLLATMNKRLIEDEGHRNKMAIGELRERMVQWLRSGEYQAQLFELNGDIIGYALFKAAEDHVYLRQFFIERRFRSRGFGKEALRWLGEKLWRGKRIRVEVLSGNTPGSQFWRASGFLDYALTLERESYFRSPDE